MLAVPIGMQLVLTRHHDPKSPIIIPCMDMVCHLAVASDCCAGPTLTVTANEVCHRHGPVVIYPVGGSACGKSLGFLFCMLVLLGGLVSAHLPDDGQRTLA